MALIGELGTTINSRLCMEADPQTREDINALARNGRIDDLGKLLRALHTVNYLYSKGGLVSKISNQSRRFLGLLGELKEFGLKLSQAATGKIPSSKNLAEKTQIAKARYIQMKKKLEGAEMCVIEALRDSGVKMMIEPALFLLPHSEQSQINIYNRGFTRTMKLPLLLLSDAQLVVQAEKAAKDIESVKLGGPLGSGLGELSLLAATLLFLAITLIVIPFLTWLDQKWGITRWLHGDTDEEIARLAQQQQDAILATNDALNSIAIDNERLRGEIRASRESGSASKIGPVAIIGSIIGLMLFGGN